MKEGDLIYISAPYGTLSFCCSDCFYFDCFYTRHDDGTYWQNDYGQCLLPDNDARFPLYFESDICEHFLECTWVPWCRW